jgi:oxaloacetate decarboxylase gamma subunit
MPPCLAATGASKTPIMVRWEGVEPPTFWFVARCSIQLSYQRTRGLLSRALWSRSTAIIGYRKRNWYIVGFNTGIVMSPDLTAIGLELVLLGMGTVFAFLTLLVFVTSLMSRLIMRFSSVETLNPVPLTATGQPGPSPVILAAVATAVRRYRDGQTQ